MDGYVYACVHAPDEEADGEEHERDEGHEHRQRDGGGYGEGVRHLWMVDGFRGVWLGVCRRIYEWIEEGRGRAKARGQWDGQTFLLTWST